MFCGQDAYVPELLARRNIQLRRLHAQAGSASRKTISKQSHLKPFFDYDFSDAQSSRIAHDFERYIKETRKNKKETPQFIDEVLNKILFLHKYNLKVAEVTFRYPLTKNFKQLLLHYVALQCNVLYRREYYTPRYETTVEERILRLLQNIFNSCFESLMTVPPNKIFEESAKAILKLLIQVKLEFDIKNKLIENIVKKLLTKLGKLENVRALKEKGIPCPLDTYLHDPAIIDTCKNIITSDYGTDDDLKIEDEYSEDYNEEQNDSCNFDVDLKPEIEDLIRTSKILPPNQDKYPKVPTIYIDDDDNIMVCLEEEVKTSNKSSRREAKKKEKQFALKEKQNKAFMNHRPITLNVLDEIKEETDDLTLDSDDELCGTNSSDSNVDNTEGKSTCLNCIAATVGDCNEISKPVPINETVHSEGKLISNASCLPQIISLAGGPEVINTPKIVKVTHILTETKNGENSSIKENTDKNYNKDYGELKKPPEKTSFIFQNSLENHPESEFSEEDKLNTFESYYVIEAGKARTATSELQDQIVQFQNKVEPTLNANQLMPRQVITDENNLTSISKVDIESGKIKMASDTMKNVGEEGYENEFIEISALSLDSEEGTYTELEKEVTVGKTSDILTLKAGQNEGTCEKRESGESKEVGEKSTIQFEHTPSVASTDDESIHQASNSNLNEETGTTKIMTSENTGEGTKDFNTLDSALCLKFEDGRCIEVENERTLDKTNEVESSDSKAGEKSTKQFKDTPSLVTTDEDSIRPVLNSSPNQETVATKIVTTDVTRAFETLLNKELVDNTEKSFLPNKILKTVATLAELAMVAAKSIEISSNRSSKEIISSFQKLEDRNVETVETPIIDIIKEANIIPIETVNEETTSREVDQTIETPIIDVVGQENVILTEAADGETTSRKVVQTIEIPIIDVVEEGNTIPTEAAHEESTKREVYQNIETPNIDVVEEESTIFTEAADEETTSHEVDQTIKLPIIDVVEEENIIPTEAAHEEITKWEVDQTIQTPVIDVVEEENTIPTEAAHEETTKWEVDQTIQTPIIDVVGDESTMFTEAADEEITSQDIDQTIELPIIDVVEEENIIPTEAAHEEITKWEVDQTIQTPVIDVVEEENISTEAAYEETTSLKVDQTIQTSIIDVVEEKSTIITEAADEEIISQDVVQTIEIPIIDVVEEENIPTEAAYEETTSRKVDQTIQTSIIDVVEEKSTIITEAGDEEIISQDVVQTIEIPIIDVVEEESIPTEAANEETISRKVNQTTEISVIDLVEEEKTIPTEAAHEETSNCEVDQTIETPITDVVEEENTISTEAAHKETSNREVDQTIETPIWDVVEEENAIFTEAACEETINWDVCKTIEIPIINVVEEENIPTEAAYEETTNEKVDLEAEADADNGIVSSINEKEISISVDKLPKHTQLKSVTTSSEELCENSDLLKVPIDEIDAQTYANKIVVIQNICIKKGDDKYILGNNKKVNGKDIDTEKHRDIENVEDNRISTDVSDILNDKVRPTDKSALKNTEKSDIQKGTASLVGDSSVDAVINLIDDIRLEEKNELTSEKSSKESDTDKEVNQNIFVTSPGHIEKTIVSIEKAKVEEELIKSIIEKERKSVTDFDDAVNGESGILRKEKIFAKSTGDSETLVDRQMEEFNEEITSNALETPENKVRSYQEKCLDQEARKKSIKADVDDVKIEKPLEKSVEITQKVEFDKNKTALVTEFTKSCAVDQCSKEKTALNEEIPNYEREICIDTDIIQKDKCIVSIVDDFNQEEIVCDENSDGRGGAGLISNRHKTIELTCHEEIHEDLKELNFINELNIQKEEIITETVILKPSVSKAIIARETLSDNTVDEKINIESEKSSSSQIMSHDAPRDVSLDASGSMLEKMKDALMKIGTEILVANSELKEEPGKVVQDLEICAIPNQNTPLDILAIVASEVPRQNLLTSKTSKRKGKKGVKKGRKKQSMYKNKSKVAKSKQPEPAKAEIEFEQKCKPHDFVIISSSEVPPPANNIYAQKLPDLNVTSEDSNDSEGILLIDEDADLKHSKEPRRIEENKMNESNSSQTEKLSVFDEDTLEEDFSFAYEPRVKGTILISIPDNYQANYPILKQIEEMELCCSNKLDNKNSEEEIDHKNKTNGFINETNNLTDQTINQTNSDTLDTNSLNEDASNVDNKEIDNAGLKNLSENINLAVNCCKPFRTMAERKNYDKPKLNPYVSIERLNVCCKVKEEEKCIRTRSKSFDISVIRNFDRTYLHVQADQEECLEEKTATLTTKIDPEPEVCVEENVPENSDELKLTQATVKSTTHLNDENLPLAKLKTSLLTEAQIIDTTLDDVPLLLRKQTKSKRRRKRKFNPKTAKQKKEKVDKRQIESETKSAKPKKNKGKIVAAKNNKDVVTTRLRRKSSLDRLEDVTCSTTLNQDKLSEKDAVPSDFRDCTSAAASDESLSLGKKNNSVIKLETEHIETNLNKSEGALTLPHNTPQKTESNINANEEDGNSNRKYWITPKLRSKSIYKDNLNIIERRSAEVVPEDSLNSSAVSDEKKLPAPNNKSVLTKDTPRKPSKQLCKVNILSNCKSTISPTTEKLKRKLEIDFQLNCDDVCNKPAVKSTGNVTLDQLIDKDNNDQVKETNVVSRGKSKRNKSKNKSKSFVEDECTATRNQKNEPHYDIPIVTSNEKISEENVHYDLVHFDKDCINDQNVINEEIVEHSETLHGQPLNITPKIDEIDVTSTEELESSQAYGNDHISSDAELEDILSGVSQTIKEMDKSRELDNNGRSSFECETSHLHLDQTEHNQKPEVVLEKEVNISSEANIKQKNPEIADSLSLVPSMIQKEVNVEKPVQKIKINENENLPRVEYREEKPLDLDQISSQADLPCDKVDKKANSGYEDSKNDLDNIPLLERALKHNANKSEKIVKVDENKKNKERSKPAEQKPKVQKDVKINEVDTIVEKKRCKEKAVVTKVISECAEDKVKFDEVVNNTQANSQHSRKKKSGDKQNSAPNKQDVGDKNNSDSKEQRSETKLAKTIKKTVVDDIANKNKNTVVELDRISHKKGEDGVGKNKKQVTDTDKKDIKDKPKDVKEDKESSKISKKIREPRKSTTDKSQTPSIQTRSTDISKTHDNDPQNIANTKQHPSTSKHSNSKIFRDSRKKEHDTELHEKSSSDKNKSYIKSKSSSRKQSPTPSKHDRYEHDKDRSRHKSTSRSSSVSSRSSSKPATPNSELFDKYDKLKYRSASVSSSSSSSKRATPDISEKERRRHSDRRRSGSKDHSKSSRSLSRSHSSVVNAASTSDRSSKSNSDKRSVGSRSSSSSEKSSKPAKNNEIKVDVGETRNELSEEDHKRKNKKEEKRKIESMTCSNQNDVSPTKKRKIEESDVKAKEGDRRVSKTKMKHPEATKTKEKLKLPTDHSLEKLNSDNQVTDFTANIKDVNKLKDTEDTIRIRHGKELKSDLEKAKDCQSSIGSDTGDSKLCTNSKISKTKMKHPEVSKSMEKLKLPTDCSSEKLNGNNQVADYAADIKDISKLKENKGTPIIHHVKEVKSGLEKAKDPGSSTLGAACDLNLSSDRKVSKTKRKPSEITKARKEVKSQTDCISAKLYSKNQVTDNTTDKKGVITLKENEGTLTVHYVKEAKSDQEKSKDSQEFAMLDDVLLNRDSEASNVGNINQTSKSIDGITQVKTVSPSDNVNNVTKETAEEFVKSGSLNAEKVNETTVTKLEEISMDSLNSHSTEIDNIQSTNEELLKPLNVQELTKDTTSMESLDIEKPNEQNAGDPSSKLGQTSEELGEVKTIPSNTVSLTDDDVSKVTEETHLEELATDSTHSDVLGQDVSEKAPKLKQNLEKINGKVAEGDTGNMSYNSTTALEATNPEVTKTCIKSTPSQLEANNESFKKSSIVKQNLEEIEKHKMNVVCPNDDKVPEVKCLDEIAQELTKLLDIEVNAEEGEVVQASGVCLEDNLVEEPVVACLEKRITNPTISSNIKLNEISDDAFGRESQVKCLEDVTKDSINTAVHEMIQSSKDQNNEFINDGITQNLDAKNSIDIKDYAKLNSVNVVDGIKIFEKPNSRVDQSLEGDAIEKGKIAFLGTANNNLIEVSETKSVGDTSNDLENLGAFHVGQLKESEADKLLSGLQQENTAKNFGIADLNKVAEKCVTQQENNKSQLINRDIKNETAKLKTGEIQQNKEVQEIKLTPDFDVEKNKDVARSSKVKYEHKAAKDIQEKASAQNSSLSTEEIDQQNNKMTSQDKRLKEREMPSCSVAETTKLENNKNEPKLINTSNIALKTAKRKNKAIIKLNKEVQEIKQVPHNAVEQNEEGTRLCLNVPKCTIPTGLLDLTKNLSMVQTSSSDNTTTIKQTPGYAIEQNKEISYETTTKIKSNNLMVKGTVKKITEPGQKKQLQKNIEVSGLNDAENKQKDTTGVPLLNEVLSHTKYIPDVRRKRVCGRDVKLKNIEDAFEQYLPTKPKESEEIVMKTGSNDSVTEVQDKPTSPSESNGQLINNKRKSIVLDLEQASVTKENVPVPDLSNKKARIEELNIDVTCEIQLNNKPTQISPLSISPKKKERKSIEVIINHLKEEQSSNFASNEDNMQTVPKSSLVDGVNVDKLRSKLLHKIKYSDQGLASPTREVLPSSLNNAGASLKQIPTGREIHKVVPGKSVFNILPTKNDFQTHDSSKESDPTVEVDGDSISYLSKKFNTITGTTRVEYNIEIENKSKLTIPGYDATVLVPTADISQFVATPKDNGDENSFLTTQSNAYVHDSLPRTRNVTESGSQGLVSTAEDNLKFVTTTKDICNENSFLTVQSNAHVHDSLPRKLDVTGSGSQFLVSTTEDNLKSVATLKDNSSENSCLTIQSNAHVHDSLPRTLDMTGSGSQFLVSTTEKNIKSVATPKDNCSENSFLTVQSNAHVHDSLPRTLDVTGSGLQFLVSTTEKNLKSVAMPKDNCNENSFLMVKSNAHLHDSLPRTLDVTGSGSQFLVSTTENNLKSVATPKDNCNENSFLTVKSNAHLHDSLPRTLDVTGSGSQFLVSTTEDNLNSVATPKDNCNENSFLTVQSNAYVHNSLPIKHDVMALGKEAIIQSPFNDVIDSSFISNTLVIPSMENNVIGSLASSTSGETPNLLNLTNMGEITVSPETVCIFPDIISTTINSTENKLPCSQERELFTFPSTSEAGIKEEFIPLNDVSSSSIFLDDPNSPAGEVGSLHKSSVFSFGEQINNSNARTLASPELAINLQDVPFSSIPIDSTQSLDLISPKSLSMVQTSRSDNFTNDVPVENDIGGVMTEIPIPSNEPDDHNYTLGSFGGPLLSGRPEQANKNISPTTFNKSFDDSPNEFFLNDAQLQEFGELDNTYKLNLENEYAVTNLLILGSQTSTDTNAFSVTNYGMADIKRINLMECSVPNSEENTNSKDYLDPTISIKQEVESSPTDTNPWAEFIANENPNQKVVVLPNEQCFGIAPNGLAESPAVENSANTQAAVPISPCVGEISSLQGTYKSGLPAKAANGSANKTNSRNNRKTVPETSAQRNNSLTDLLKRRYSRTVLRPENKNAPVSSVKETKKLVTVENAGVPKVGVFSVMTAQVTPLTDTSIAATSVAEPVVHPEKTVKKPSNGADRPIFDLVVPQYENKRKSPSHSHLSPARDALDKQSLKAKPCQAIPSSKDLSDKGNFQQKPSERKKSPWGPPKDLLQSTCSNVATVAENIDFPKASGIVQSIADIVKSRVRTATSKYPKNDSPPTEPPKPPKSTSKAKSHSEHVGVFNITNEVRSKIDSAQPAQDWPKTESQVQRSPVRSSFASTKPAAKVDSKGRSSGQTRSNQKNITPDTSDIAPPTITDNLTKSIDHLMKYDLLLKKPTIPLNTPAKPPKSVTSKYNYSIDSILGKDPKSYPNSYNHENSVKDYRQSKSRGAKRSFSTLEVDEREPGKADKKQRKPDREGAQKDLSSRNATFDKLLQQGNVNRLISLRVTEDQRLKLERRSSPLLSERRTSPLTAEKRGGLSSTERRTSPLTAEKRSSLSSTERRTSPLTAEKRSSVSSTEKINSPLLNSHPKEKTERRDKLKPETRSSPLVTNSYGANEERNERDGSLRLERRSSPYSRNNQRNSNHSRSSVHPVYDRPEDRRTHGRRSDHTRRREGHGLDYSSTSAHSTRNSQPSSSRSNVSALYYTNPISSQGNQNVDPSSGPYTMRNSKLSEEQKKELIRSCRVKILDPLRPIEKSEDEGEYSWIEKFNQRIPSELLGINASAPQFIPHPSP